MSHPSSAQTTGVAPLRTEALKPLHRFTGGVRSSAIVFLVLAAVAFIL